jgi:hypothetical protein
MNRREYWKSLARSDHCVVRRSERVYVNRASGACRRDLPLQADGLVSAVAVTQIVTILFHFASRAFARKKR